MSMLARRAVGVAAMGDLRVKTADANCTWARKGRLAARMLQVPASFRELTPSSTIGILFSFIKNQLHLL